jgi:hypothetical protein
VTVETDILSQYVPGFRANLNLAPQQAVSKLVAAVDSDLAYDGVGEMFNMDDVAESDPEDVTTRVPDTPDKFISVGRRVAFFREFHDSAWFDNVDKVKEITDPTSTMMRSMMAGLGRKRDLYIQAQMFGNTFTKSDNTDGSIAASAFPAGQIIAANIQTNIHQAETIPGGAVDYGLSVGKVIEANRLLDESELEGERFMLLSSNQKSDLLQRTPVTSKFYLEVEALHSGKLSSFMGFTIITMASKRMQKVGNNRLIPAWIKEAIQYKSRMITNASIRIRNDKSDTPQAFYKASHAGGRRYDNAVVQILCKE